MAKSLKVEDYWRNNNLENLLKEITQLLARRMPTDPALAIVEHLQKKFPKSFKTILDTKGIASKTTAINSRVQSITSPHSDHQNESLNDTLTDRRSSNQSGIVTIPSMGSAFTNLLKQNTTSENLTPEISIKNLVFANRLSQYAVKMGKDIRSDHDILEEELIKPSKHKSITVNTSENLTMEDEQAPERHEQSSIPQLIRYKQQIHTEHDRRVHREKLAALAKSFREKESFIQSDFPVKLEEIHGQNLEHAETSAQVVPTENQTRANVSHKPMAASKEEEEILNDENIFQLRRQRDRERSKKKSVSSQLHTPRIAQQIVPNTGRSNGNIICKVCGNMVNADNNPLMTQTKQPSATSELHSFQPQPSSQSIETIGSAIDDWFESPSNVSVSRESISGTPDDPGPYPTGSITFRRSLFQPVSDMDEDHSPPPIRPSIPSINEEKKLQRLNTSRLSESGMFARSPDTKLVRPSSTRSTPSPTPKKH